MCILWAALIVRASIGARSWLWLTVWTIIPYSLSWGWLLRWSIDVTGPGYPAMVAYSAAWMVLFVLLFRRVHRCGVTASIPLAVLAPILWVGLEYLRAEWFLGAWPWYLAGLQLIEWPLVCQIADLGGVWMVGLLLLCVGGALAEWFRPRPRRRQALISTVLAALFCLCAVAYGLFSFTAQQESSLGRFLIVQTNIKASNKVAATYEQQLVDASQFMKMSIEGLREAGGADLIIWPETMLPDIGFDPATTRDILEQSPGWGRPFQTRIEEAVVHLDTPMLVGTSTWADGIDRSILESEGQFVPTNRYNSAVLILPDGGLDSYHKIFPTPFGERLPWIDAWPWLREKMLDFGGPGILLELDAGPEPTVLDLPRLEDDPLVLITPICFEATVPSVTRSLFRSGSGVSSPDLIVNLTNDGWFGDIDGGRSSHAQAARFRCIELRAPMIRCANTGQSGLFDSSGRLVASLPSREGGVLLAEPMGDSRRTLYVLVGNLVPVSCLLFAVLSCLLTLKSARSE
tara:strand:+ start:2919 stop:4466 length:1548 start_codon:yes stop_codon:yes gene_type:complete